jgi:hypothetical protein
VPPVRSTCGIRWLTIASSSLTPCFVFRGFLVSSLLFLLIFETVLFYRIAQMPIPRHNILSDRIFA